MIKKNDSGLGKNQKNALKFCKKNPGWHAVAKDGTEKMILKLAERKLVKIKKEGNILSFSRIN